MLGCYKESLVSVIIPSFNRCKYIKEAVASVLAQNYGNIEIIVIDDGSTDGSFDLLSELESNGDIVLLCHNERENKGQSASINLGLKSANGEFIAILDSDDLLAPGSIKRHSEFLAKNPDMGLVYGYGEAIDSEGNLLKYRTLPASHCESGDPSSILLNCYIAIPGGTMVRAKSYELVGYFEEKFRAAQDHDMAIRLFEAVNVAYLGEASFYYRKHCDSISANFLERRWKTGFEILSRAECRYSYSGSVIRRRRAVLNYNLGLVLLRSGRYIKGIYHVLLAGFLDPFRSLRVVFGIEK
ncbi:glycosyltransferase [Marinobacter sp. 1Y8]